VNSSAPFLSASAAARQLGVSAKALRLYEQHGLISPNRSPAGWRAYGPDTMARAAEIVTLRALGLSLSQVARVLGDDPQALAPALAAHQIALEGDIRRLTSTIDRVRRIRAGLAQGKSPTAGELMHLLRPSAQFTVAFDLPWPWGGERFEFGVVKPLNYIVGPLGSGKTRLAKRLAETLPDAVFLGLDRLEPGSVATRAQLEANPVLRSRVEEALDWLVEDGATTSEALVALVTGLQFEGAAIIVVDMVEQGLNQSTQEAVIAYLRRRGPEARPLFLMTRSCAILDLAAVGPDESILFCPANHSPPMIVAPYPGAAGYEAVATCLASPEVRARSESVIAWRSQVA
jgi:DNA-binding transcriptional MerR regulator